MQLLIPRFCRYADTYVDGFSYNTEVLDGRRLKCSIERELP